MSVNEFDRTELQECQSDRNYCGRCKNGLCKFNPLVSSDDEMAAMVDAGKMRRDFNDE
jgi:hypothetical protein